MGFATGSANRRAMQLETNEHRHVHQARRTSGAAAAAGVRIDGQGNRLPSIDDLWVVVGASLDGIEIRCALNPKLTCKLEADQVHGLLFDRERGRNEPGS